MTSAPLTVHNAEITTAAVEVKTLTIKGKQVTLAVFRQIQAEDLFDAELAYRGNPWGRVNYHVGCDHLARHLHVVWQKDAELRRDAVLRPTPSSGGDYGPSTMEVSSWVSAAALYLVANPAASDPRAGFSALHRDAKGNYTLVLDDMEEPIDWARYAPRRGWDGWDPPPSIDSVHAKWDAVVESWLTSRRRCEARSQRWREIESLPQLFIAV